MEHWNAYSKYNGKYPSAQGYSEAGVTKYCQDTSSAYHGHDGTPPVKKLPVRRQIIQMATSTACSSQASSSWIQEVNQ